MDAKNRLINTDALARADLANAVANSKLADVTADCFHTLVKESYVSKQQDDQGTADAAAKAAAVESARANLSRMDSLVGFKTLVAPFDGVVTQRAIELGRLMTAGGTAGNPLFQIADEHRVRIYVRVPQAYIDFLKPGVTASLRTPQYPGQDFIPVRISPRRWSRRQTRSQRRARRQSADDRGKRAREDELRPTRAASFACALVSSE